MTCKLWFCCGFSLDPKKQNKVVVMKKLIIVVVAFLYEKVNNYQEEAPFNLMSIAKLHIGRRGGFG
jgi:hypothetical protein